MMLQAIELSKLSKEIRNESVFHLVPEPTQNNSQSPLQHLHKCRAV